MCGIVGIINASYVHPSTKSRTMYYFTKAGDFLRDALIASGVRGMDSTGVFQVAHDNKFYVHKLAVSSGVFVTDKTTKAYLSDSCKAPITVAHVRDATSGKVSYSNSHPFIVDYEVGDEGHALVGVHNGTLTDWIRHDKDRRFDVDSEWALDKIANEKYDAFADGTIKGSYSFVWWDTEQPYLLHFARRDRPMWAVRTKDKRHILFGSEPGMLSWVAGRHAIELEEEIFSMDQNVWHVVDTSKSELEIETRCELPTPVVTTTITSSGIGIGNKHFGTTTTDYRKTNISEAIKALLNKKPAKSTDDEAAKEPAVLFSKADVLGKATPEQILTDASATPSEEVEAKKLGIYGQIVEFEGQQELDGCMIGLVDIVDPDSPDSTVAADAVCEVISNVTPKLYDVFYCAVIGVTEGKFEDSRTFILSPLTKEGNRVATERVLEDCISKTCTTELTL